jgi:hypothetical protein
MNSQVTVTLKKSHFAGQLRVMSDSVSNGQWAIRKTAVKNAVIFASAELARQSLGIDDARDMENSTFKTIFPGGELHEWKATKFCYVADRIQARMFQSVKTGELAGIDMKILDVIGLTDECASVFGVDPLKPFVNAATREDATFVAMPYRRIEPFPEAKPKETK